MTQNRSSDAMAQQLYDTSIPVLRDVKPDQKADTRLSFGMRPLLLIVLLAGVLGLFFINLRLGSVEIPDDQIVKAILNQPTERLAYTRIVRDIRLPKALTAILAGAALGVSGLQMQTFFRNPLAGPFVLGISSGASLGVALLVLSTATIPAATVFAGLTTAGPFSIAIAASLGAALVMLLVLAVSMFVEGNMTLLIVGLMFSYMTGGIVSLLLYFSITEQIQAYIDWTFGSFNGVTWSRMEVFAPIIIVGLIASLLLSKSLNALLLGETYARTMGLSVFRARLLIILSTAVLAGTVTAFCGPISFLGLAVPHLCRSLFNTSDHRILVPGTVLMGAILALIAALIATLPGQNETLPLNAVTAFIGAPIIIWVILVRRNLQKSFAA